MNQPPFRIPDAHPLKPKLVKFTEEEAVVQQYGVSALLCCGLGLLTSMQGPRKVLFGECRDEGGDD